MSKRNGKYPPKNGKHANSTPKPPGASGRNGLPPPEETRWKPGQPSPNPHGRPRKLRDLQELIKDVMGESLTSDITRIKAAIRLGLNKNPAIWLEYAFGKVPQTNINIDGRMRVIQLLREGIITPDDVIAEIGHDLATELFESAGITIAQDASVGAEGDPSNPPESPRYSLSTLAPRSVDDSRSPGKNQNGIDGETMGQDDDGG